MVNGSLEAIWVGGLQGFERTQITKTTDSNYEGAGMTVK
jgi:hypothetical protein